MRGFILTPSEARRTNNVVKNFERRPVNKLPRLQKRQLVSGGSCTEQIRLNVFGAPTGGDLVLSVKVNGGTAQPVTISIPASAGEIEDDFEAHPDIDAGQCVVTSVGGSLPSQEMTIKFVNGLSVGDVEIVSQTDSGMTGGSAYTYSHIRSCCG